MTQVPAKKEHRLRERRFVLDDGSVFDVMALVACAVRPNQSIARPKSTSRQIEGKDTKRNSTQSRNWAGCYPAESYLRRWD